MKKVIFLLLISLCVCTAAMGQASSAEPSANPAATTAEKPKRQIFRATKDQIKEVQTMLKAKGTYSGDVTGKMDDGFRTAIKGFQKENGLRETGTLNRATLEKMGVELTDSQKAIPVSANSFASAQDDSKSRSRNRGPVFRASIKQIQTAQRLLKEKSLYSGEETGKLDDATREALKKYQADNSIEATGRLDRATLEKMGIAFTDRQKEIIAASQK